MLKVIVLFKQNDAFQYFQYFSMMLQLLMVALNLMLGSLIYNNTIIFELFNIVGFFVRRTILVVFNH